MRLPRPSAFSAVESLRRRRAVAAESRSAL